MADNSENHFVQLADKFAAITEIEQALAKQRSTLFGAMVASWIHMSKSDKEIARKTLVQLGKEGKLTLVNEPEFGKAFHTAVHKRLVTLNSRSDSNGK